jgi:basic amino acid/polyamine antiporter, APA family
MTSPDHPISHHTSAIGFSRALGLFSLIAIAVNGVIGSGIFVLPATVAALMGPASPAAYIVAAALTALVVLCFAEAASRFEETGGPYIYARTAFGRFVGFEVGWMFFLSRLAAAGAIANACAAYAGTFWPALASGGGRAALLTVIIGGLAAVNVVGVRQGAVVVNVLMIAKLGPLLALLAAGLPFVDPARFDLIPDGAAGGLREASLLLIFAFGGFENASVPAAEATRPRRDVPIALVTAICLTAILYVLIQIVALSVLPGLARDATPLASAAATIFGPQGAAIVSAGALVSTVGSLSALALVGPRILFALGAWGDLPHQLARVHPRFRTPHVAIVAFAVIAWLASLAANFSQLAIVSAIARLLFSASTCLAVPLLRRRQPAATALVLPGGPLVPIAAAAASVWLLTGITRGQAIAGLLALAAGVLLYFGGTRLQPGSALRSGDTAQSE